MKFTNATWALLFALNFGLILATLTQIFQSSTGQSITHIIQFIKENAVETPDTSKDVEPKTFSFFFYNLKIALASTVIANALHLAMAILMPVLYIRINLYVVLCSTIAASVSEIHFIFNASTRSPWYVVFPILTIALGIWSYLYRRRFIQTSASLMKTSSRIVIKYPALILIELIQSVITIVTTFVFMIPFAAATLNSDYHLNMFQIIYSVFSYYWIIMTLYYICYMTISATAGSEFLQTDERVKVSTFTVFSRIITHQFGTAALAGLLISVIFVLQLLADMANPKNKKEKKDSDDDKDDDDKTDFIVTLIQTILYYLLKFVLDLLEAVYKDITRHALIYCSIYDFSYQDGCKRWLATNFYEKIVKLNHSNIISSSLLVNFLVFTVIGTGISYFTLKTTGQTLDFLVLTPILMMGCFFILSSLITTTFDTIYLCYLENPAQLKKQYKSLCTDLNQIML